MGATASDFAAIEARIDAIAAVLHAAASGESPVAAPHPGPLPASGERELHSLSPWSAAERGEGWGEGREQTREGQEQTREAQDRAPLPADIATELLGLGERVLEAWVTARAEVPTTELKEGFRLLALHRQGARGEPSFNACRETCRELVYHHNLVRSEPDHPETVKRLRLMVMVARHLALFVSGKMQVAGLGEFCCSSRPVRSGPDAA